ncbi:FxSxx-COOH system tetratricopeptide repeat protein [Sorangium sp. So ce448]|uniref:FxSxx-COOH system tetratricopeptide repeat protein n=1 Tax=Sorangium sp. So ce448 TaxID=3133314 RepID=UPI003F5F8DDC
MDDEILEQLRERYTSGNLIAFAGAGVSAAAGMPTWKQLAEQFLGRARTKGADAAALEEIQHYIASNQLIHALSAAKLALGPQDFNASVDKALDDRGRDIPEAALAIAALRPKLKAVLTTNIDRFLERAFAGEWRPVDRPTGDLAMDSHYILKLHGTLRAWDTWVFSRDQYDRAIFGSPLLQDAFGALYRTHSILFVGFGLADDNIDETLSRVRALSGGQPSTHFALLPKGVPPFRRRLLEESGIRLLIYENEAGDHAEVARILRSLGPSAALPCASTSAVIGGHPGLGVELPHQHSGRAAVDSCFHHDAAEQLRRSSIKLESQSQCPVTPRMPPNNLPTQLRNFVGRAAELKELEGLLAREREASVVQSRHASVYGLGGIGKTTLAIEYAYRNADRYPGGIWWINAEDDPLTSIVALADELRTVGPPTLQVMLRDLPDARDRIAAVVRVALQNQQSPSLLVLDNLVDLAWKRFLPAGSVHVLVTTRDERVAIGRPVPLDVLSCDDAKSLAVLRAGEPANSEEAQAMGRVVCGLLGGLAVAVEMSARAVEQWAYSWVKYERYLELHPSSLLNQEEPRSDYPRSVLAALRLSIDRCKPGSPERQLLDVAAYLAPDHIAVEPLVAALSLDSVDAAKALAILDGLGLAKIDEHVDYMSMHRLVQEVVKTVVGSGEAVADLEIALRIVNDGFPESSDEVETWPWCELWLPHAKAVTRQAEIYDVAKDVRGRLLARFAVYLQGRAAFAEAKGYLQRALALHEAVFGNDDPKVAAVLRSLGSVLHDLGDLGGARAHLERALTIDLAHFGPDHPDVARDVNDLGSVIMDQGDLPTARKHLQRALAIDEATYGPDDPSVAIRLNNLGALLRDTGDFAGARVYLERALAIDIRAYGPDHPTVAIGRTNLGRLLHDLGDLKGAREQFAEALKIDEHSYGTYHPRFALALNNRGRVLRDLGDLAGARADFERALAIVEDTYGPDHPDVARDINNLGSVLRDLGDLEGARAHFARVVKMAEVTYGPAHPAVAIGCNNLGSVLQSLGQLAAAREQLERALSIAEATYGPAHPVIASIVNNLGRVLQALGDIPGAWQQIERAVSIATKALGLTHPSVQIFSRNLARIGEVYPAALLDHDLTEGPGRRRSH